MSLHPQIQPPIALNVYVPRQQLPLTPTDVIVNDCWICMMHIVNDGAGDATVRVHDKQNPPGALIPSINLPRGGLISEQSKPGVFMQGGVTWSASAAGVWGYIVGVDLTDGLQWSSETI